MKEDKKILVGLAVVASENYKWLFLGAGIASGILLAVLFMRRGSISRLHQRQLLPVARSFTPVREFVPMRRYINKETVDITWNTDGFPVKIVTERDATQGAV